MKIAIMQPYFLPYGGYFRLFCAADLFVVYDCVQFPRRGWVHRNQVGKNSTDLDWITLPLQKQPVNTPIKDLKFRVGADLEWQHNLLKYDSFKRIRAKFPGFFSLINELDSTPVDYIVNSLREICQIIELPFNIVYSSELNLPDTLKGQSRILQIANYFKANIYINSPGGRDLYEEEKFSQEGIKLQFLPDYQNGFQSIIQCLIEQDPPQIKRMLYSQI